MANKILLSTNTNILSNNSLCLIYNVHTHSHLLYGLLAWGPMASKKALKDLTSIQDSCVCLVCKVGRNTNVMPLYNKQQLIRLPDMIKLELAKYGHRQTTKNYPASLWQIANANGGTKSIAIRLDQRTPLTYRPTPCIKLIVVIFVRELLHIVNY